MSLKRYLSIVYILTLAGLVIVAWAMRGLEGIGMLALSPFLALASTFVIVWPWARTVPVEQRTSYRSYQSTNLFVGVLLALFALVIATKIGSDL